MQHDPTMCATFGPCSSIAGAVLDFFLAVEVDIFVGMPVSSFSTDVNATRFYRNLTNSLFYLPEGIVPALAPHDTAPPRCAC